MPYFGPITAGARHASSVGTGIAVSRDPSVFLPRGGDSGRSASASLARRRAARTARRRMQRGRSEAGRRRSYRVGAQDLQEEGPAGGCAAGSAAQAALCEAERSASAESGGGAPAQAFPRLTPQALGGTASLRWPFA